MELQILENELIPVFTTDTGEKVVYGTDLYKVLESKQEFSNWVKSRLGECESTEDEDFTIILSKSTGGRPGKEYIIQLDTAKEMAMLERNEVGKKVRKYFIKVEKKYKQLSLMDGVSKELRAIIMQDKKLQAITEHMEETADRVDNLEDNMTINSAQRKSLKELKKSVSASTLGGYRSNAYNDESIRRKVYRSVWRDYNDHFEITTYTDTPTSRLQEGKDYLEGWQPNNNLRLEIREANRAVV